LFPSNPDRDFKVTDGFGHQLWTVGFTPITVYACVGNKFYPEDSSRNNYTTQMHLPAIAVVGLQQRTHAHILLPAYHAVQAGLMEFKIPVYFIPPPAEPHTDDNGQQLKDQYTALIKNRVELTSSSSSSSSTKPATPAQKVQQFQAILTDYVPGSLRTTNVARFSNIIVSNDAVHTNFPTPLPVYKFQDKINTPRNHPIGTVGSRKFPTISGVHSLHQIVVEQTANRSPSPTYTSCTTRSKEGARIPTKTRQQLVTGTPPRLNPPRSSKSKPGLTQKYDEISITPVGHSRPEPENFSDIEDPDDDDELPFKPKRRSPLSSRKAPAEPVSIQKPAKARPSPSEQALEIMREKAR
jgi:hypothetical protein